ncbi:collagen alpha-1(XIV) chain-like [Vanacampus margaritifer]
MATVNLSAQSNGSDLPVQSEMTTDLPVQSEMATVNLSAQSNGSDLPVQSEMTTDLSVQSEITTVNLSAQSNGSATGSPEEENVTCDTTTAADMVFLVDGSGSIGLSNFQLILIFLENLVQGFMVDINQIRVGLVQFSTQPRLEWNLTTHMTKAAVVDAIRNLTYATGGTATASALTFVLENSFTAEFGSRANVPKVLFLITDGQSNGNVRAPAQALRDAGIQVFAVGVGNANEDELRLIASPPPETHVFNVVDFDVISGIEGSLITSICDMVEEIAGIKNDSIGEAKVYAHIKARVIHAMGVNVTEIFQQFLLNITRNVCTDCRVEVDTTVTQEQTPPV